MDDAADEGAAKPLTLYGYWRGNGDQNDRYPDPAELVDESWPVEERERVAAYLDTAPAIRHYRGLSSCRLCGILNGVSERSDGRYVWPEGLSHYVREHAVKLPEALLAHIDAQLAGQ